MNDYTLITEENHQRALKAAYFAYKALQTLEAGNVSPKEFKAAKCDRALAICRDLFAEREARLLEEVIAEQSLTAWNDPPPSKAEEIAEALMWAAKNNEVKP